MNIADIVGVGIALRRGKGSGAGVNGFHLIAGAGEVQRETSRGRKAIERAARGKTRGGEIVFALVEKNAGFLPVGQIGFHTKAVHVNFHGTGQLAFQHFDFAGQVFERAYPGIITCNDGARGELRFKRGDDFGSGAVHALVQCLNGKGVVITVNDERGKEVRFGIDEPVRVSIGDHKFTEALRGRDAGADIDGFRGTAHHAQRDLRGGAVMRLSDELAPRIEHADGIARLGMGGGCHVRAEDPGVTGAPPVRTFAGDANFG